MSTVAAVARNADLRRVLLAFACFSSAEWAVWIAMLVYAYRNGGATEAGIVALVQLVPAGLFAPFAGGLADRFSPTRMLTLGYAAQAVAMAATAAALLAGAPAPIVYALAAVVTTAVTIPRPTQSALTPALARSPDELTATNAVAGWVESASVLAAPAATGALLEFSGPGTVFAVMAALAALAALLVAPLRVPAAVGSSVSVRGGLRALAKEPAARTLVGALAAQYVLIGALDVLLVVLAIGVLDLGGPGAGYLNAAFGAGGVAGIAATLALIGRRRLAPALLLGAGVWAAAFAAIAAHPTVVGTFVLLAAAGAGRSLFDVAGRTLLQRTAPPGLLARAFGALEGLSMAGLALGAVLAPVLVAIGGARTAFAGAGALLPLALAVAGRSLVTADRNAVVPIVEISLLRALPVFAPLGAPALEGLARSLVPVRVRQGEAVVQRGDHGRRFYVVASGELEVEGYGTLGRGEGFGEIALLLDVPRTATVRARTDAQLYALDREPFLAAVTGHPQSSAEAERLAHERLAATRMAT